MTDDLRLIEDYVPIEAISAEASRGHRIVWNPLEDDRELVSIHNPAEKLDHAKKEVVAARMFVIPASAIAKGR